MQASGSNTFPLELRGPASGVSKAQDDKAFHQLVVEHAPYVWRVLRSLGVSEADLPDVAQEAFLVVHRQLPTFEGRSSLRTWIYGIVLRVASDYRSKAYRRRERATDEVPDLAALAGPETELQRREAWLLVNQLLEGLDEDRRQVFVLYEIEQLGMREVASIIGCPLTTAYSRLHSARQAVQTELQARRQREEGCP
ncbi:MAG: RNA polymerase sigma factor [Myxococcales bacterium]